MTDDERQAILEQAHRNVARLADLEAEPARDPLREDAQVRWQRQQPKAAPPPKPRELTEAELNNLRSQQWAAFVDSRITLAQENLREFWRDVAAHVIAEERKRMRAEVAEAVGKLRAELAVERAAERSSDIIELPAWPKRNAA